MTVLFLKKIRVASLVLGIGLLGLSTAHAENDPLILESLTPVGFLKVESIEAESLEEAFFARCLLNTSGKVYSIQQGKKTSQFSNTTKVEVRVEKTDGKAKTEVKICLWSPGVGMGLTVVKKTYVFEKGNYKRTKTFKVFKAKDKKVVVYIDNKSVTNTFSYKLRVDEL